MNRPEEREVAILKLAQSCKTESLVQELKSAEVQNVEAWAKPESTEGRPWGQPLKKPAGAPLNLG